MTMANETMTLERLQHLLDVHGANVVRWPGDEARALRTLTAASPAARAMLAEAQAFDDVLKLATGAPTIRLASLTDRIVASATLGSQLSVAAPSRPVARPTANRAAHRAKWPAIAAMAASLLIGVYAGFNGWAPQGLQQVSWLSDDQAASVSADDFSQYGDIL